MYRTMVWLYFSLNLQTLDLEVGILKAELPHSQKQGCDGLALSDIRDFISILERFQSPLQGCRRKGPAKGTMYNYDMPV
jgi:hypothetical protein